MLKNFYLLLILLVVQCKNCYAQYDIETPLLRHYSRASGLPSDYVNSMYQDKKGYIWIATDKGICRYNGVKYEYFSTDNGLPDNMAYSFFEDQQNNIWIKCYGNKIAMFDGQTLTDYSKKYPQELENVINIQADAQNNLYFFNSRSEVLQFNAKNEWFKTKLDYNLQLNDNNINQIFAISPNQSLIFAGKILLLTYSHTQVHVKELFFCKKDKNKFNNFEFIENLENNNNNTQFKIKTDAKYYAAIIKNDSIYYNFLSDLDTKNEEIQKKIVDNLKKEANLVNQMLDYEGNLWIYTFGKGIFRYKGNYLKHYANIKDDIDFVSVENNENIHFGGKQGYYIITPNEVFSSKNTQNKHIKDIRSIYKNTKNQYFVGTFQNLYQFNDFDALYNSKIKNNLSSSPGISGVGEINDTLFVATFGGGLLKYANNEFLKYKNVANGLASDMIEQVITTKNAYFLPTLSNGVSRLDRKTGQITNFNKQNKLLSNMVFSVYENDNNTWIGTQNGITKYNKNQQISYYTTRNGLEGTRIYSIFEYNNKLFALSDKYLHYFIDNQFKVLRSFDIFNEENTFINKAFYHNETNLLYLCTNKGLISLDIAQALPKTTVPQLQIEYIKQNNLLFYHNVFDKKQEIITFNHKQNTLEIHFANLSFINEDKNQFYYKINKDDAPFGNDVWVKNETNILYLQNLPNGNYKIEIKLLNPDNIYSNIEVIKFNIEAPFWFTWWFLLVIFALFGVFVALIVRYLSYRKLKTHLKELEIQQKIQNEREYISRELHDNVGAQITFIISNLDYLFFVTKNQKIDELSNQARQTMTMLRETIWATNKTFFEFEELQEKLVQYIQNANISNKNLAFNLNIANIKHQFHSAQVIQLFRIAQEAIQNVIKHSNASKMSINVFKNQQNNIVLQIIDNGNGLAEEQKGHFGLQNMHKRAKELGGTLLITSKENEGTTVELTF